MNDLPFKNLPPNQRDLERAELGNKFPAELEEVDVEDKLQFTSTPLPRWKKNDEDTTYMQWSEFWS